MREKNAEYTCVGEHINLVSNRVEQMTGPVITGQRPVNTARCSGKVESEARTLLGRQSHLTTFALPSPLRREDCRRPALLAETALRRVDALSKRPTGVPMFATLPGRFLART